MVIKPIMLRAAMSVVLMVSNGVWALNEYALQADSDSGVYLDINAGLFVRRVEDNNWTLTNATESATYRRGRFGLALGADLGYQLNRSWGVELGYQWLMNQQVVCVSNNCSLPAQPVNNKDVGDTLSVRTALIYAAVRGIVPISESVSGYLKFGVAGAKNRVLFIDKTAAALRKNTITLRPTFAVGVSYHIDEIWRASLQYLMMPGGRDYSNVVANPLVEGTSGSAGIHAFPTLHLITVSIGCLITT